MPVTKVRGAQIVSDSIDSDIIKQGSVSRSDLNTTTVGGAVVARVVQGTGITINSTGADSGTGDVTINATATVTSVGLSLPNIFTVSGSPVTSSGTLTAALASQTANTFLAAPSGSAGAPSFRAIVAADIPTLNQNTTGFATTLQREDNRIISPSELAAGRLAFGFTSWTNNNASPYADFLHMRSYTDNSGGNENLVMFRKDAIGMRIWQQTFGSATAYASFKDVAWTDGTNATGTWSINTSGSAATLTTARTINGTSFNGSANITTASWGTSRTITIGNTGKAVNGLANVAWTLTEIGAERIVTAGVPNNNLGDPTVREMALFDAQYNNKTEFHPIANVWVETSTDNITWTNASPTDEQKRRLVGGDINDSSLVIPNGTAYFRIRLRAQNYVFLNALYMYWSSNGHSTQVQIFKKHDSDAWTQHTSSTATVGSWPGHLFLNFPSAIAWHPSGASGTHHHEVYVLFIPTWNPTYPSNNISLSRMQWWGGYPAGRRNLYSTNELGAAFFPNTVSATALTSTVSTGTAPFTVNSTTRVSNLNVATAGTADTWTTSRNITIGNTAKALNGSANVTWTFSEIGGAPNYFDGTGAYNVNLGSGGSEGRGIVAGYSGGSYSGIGYNVRHTTTGSTWIAPGTDTSSYLMFNSGFTFYYAGTGAAGRNLTYTTLATINASGTLNATNVTVGGNQTLHAANYNTYAPTLTGTGASGTWGISITGDATTATLLKNTRNINGTPFNGSADITTANWGTSRNITIGGTTRAVNGGAAVSWTLAEIGATPITGGTGYIQNQSSSAQSASFWINGSSIMNNLITQRANDANIGQGQIYLNGDTGNRIDFNTNGVAAPTLNTTSVGSKIVLFPQVSASSVDYALGIEINHMWFSVPTSNSRFKFYAGTTNVTSIYGNGNIVTTGEISTTGNVTGHTFGGDIGSFNELIADTTLIVGDGSNTTTAYAIIKNLYLSKDDVAGGKNLLFESDTTTIDNKKLSFKIVDSSTNSKTSVMTMTTTERVGVGTESPNAKFQVSGAGSGTEVFLVSPSGAPTVGIKADSTITDYSGLYIGNKHIIRSKDSATVFFNIQDGVTYVNSNVARTTMNSDGSLGLGITSSANINSRLHVRGTGATSATTTLRIENSTPTDILTILDNGYMRLGSQGSSAFRIYPGSVAGAGDVDLSGLFLTLNSRAGTTETGISQGFVHINGVNSTATTGIQNVLALQKGFAPTSGTASNNQIIIVPQINQTGGANGITRGLYVNPTLTAASDWRSVEWSNNTGWGLYGAGTANNYLNGSLGIKTTTPTYDLDVNGSLRSTGSTSLGGSGGTNSSTTWGIFISNNGNTFHNSYVHCQSAIMALFANPQTTVTGGYPAQSVGFSSSSPIVMMTGGTERMRITSAGNVGIGTSTPEVPFVVNGAVRLNMTSNYWGFGNSGVSMSGPVGIYASNVYQYSVDSSTAASYTFGDGNGKWNLTKSTGNNPDFKITSIGTGAFGDTITLNHTTGNIGIGTGSSTYRLDVSGSVRLKNVASELIIDNATYSELNYGSTNYFRASGAAAVINGPNIQFLVGGSERARFASTTGNLLIGTTTDSARLQVRGSGATSATNTLRVENSAGTPALIVRDDGRTFVGEDYTFTSAQRYYLLEASADGLVTFTNNTTGVAQTTGFFSGELYLDGNQPYTNHRAVNAITTCRNTSTSNIIRALYASGRTGNSGAASTVTGFTGGLNIEGSGSVTNAIALEVEMYSQTNTKTITNMYGLRVNDIINTAGTITNTYGIHVGDVTSGTQTNTAYSLYVSDANARSYFAGKVGIGQTNPANLFEVYSSTTPKLVVGSTNVGLQIVPNEWIDIASYPTDNKYIRIRANRVSNLPQLNAGTANEGYGIVDNNRYLAEPDYWIEIKLAGDGADAPVLIPCFLPST
jgi:hypothetical protein